MNPKITFITCTFALLILLCWPASKDTAVTPGRKQAVTTLSAEWTGNWDQPTGYIVKDAVTITLTENCVYGISEWADSYVSLEDPSCKTNLSARGAGSRTYPSPINSTVSWTYYAEQPKSPLTRLTIDPATKTGQIDLDIPSGYVKSKSPDSKAGEGGPATMALGMMIMAFSPGAPHPGVQVSGSPPFQELFKFKFQPNAKTISGGNHGKYSFSSKGSDGATVTATFVVDYNVSVGPPNPGAGTSHRASRGL